MSVYPALLLFLVALVFAYLGVRWWIKMQVERADEDRLADEYDDWRRN